MMEFIGCPPPVVDWLVGLLVGGLEVEDETQWIFVAFVFQAFIHTLS